MKNSFFSILLTAGALACLPDLGKALSAKPCAEGAVVASLANNEDGSLSCLLPAPSSFEGERTSGTAAQVSWAAVPDASAYRLIVQDVNTDQVISSTLEYGTSKNLSGLEPGTAYRCSLASVCPDNSVSDFIIIVVDILE